MSIEDEKRLVAEKLMGWTARTVNAKLIFKCSEAGRVDFEIHIDKWNPQSDRNCWDEIWENMSLDQWMHYFKYLSIYHADFIAYPFPSDLEKHRLQCYHTVKPEIMWKALIKTLEK